MRTHKSIAATFLVAGAYFMAEVSAQVPPGTKTPPPVTKPGDVKKNPQPTTPPGTLPPGTTPGTLPGTMPPSKLPMPPMGTPLVSQKEIGGKKLDFYVKELGSNPDAANREQCARIIPMFMPDANPYACEALVKALKDTDVNVRLAAVIAIPQVGLSDQVSQEGMTAIASMLSSDQFIIVFESVIAVGQIGPYASKLASKVIPKATTPGSWQMRKAACTTLGSIGKAVPGALIEQDLPSVSALLRVIREDKCNAVKREAAMALINIGPTTLKDWKPMLENIAKSETEKDRLTKLLCRVCLVKNDPTGAKPNDPNVAAIAAVLPSTDSAARVDALNCLGLIGDAAGSKVRDVISILNDPNELKHTEVLYAAIATLASMPAYASDSIAALKNFEQRVMDPNLKTAASQAAMSIQQRAAVVPMPMMKK
jgi:hypothetical protein